MKKIFIIGVILAMALGGTAHASTSASYLSVLNQERASRGIAPLHLSSDLMEIARTWAGQMARTGRLQHNPRLTSQVSNWWSVGENVGVGSDLLGVERAFWNSPDHRSNILDARYTDVGIAAVRGGGRVWVAVEFRQPMHRTTSAAQRRLSSGSGQHKYPGRFLRAGVTGPAVAFVQRTLGLRPTGVFGDRTERAVLAFQRRHHLAVDGIVGPITWSALRRARA